MSSAPSTDPAAVDVAALTSALGDAVALPGSEAYQRAASPENTSVQQAPAAVLRPRDGAEAARAVAATVAAGGVVAVQSTGHGAGRAVGPDVVLLDTSGLDAISIDSGDRTATVGAGVRWSDVQARAQDAGLIALSGTAPDVGVVGYTTAGGVGWLTRPHGLASAQLRTVGYVDGAGRERRAAADAADELDREALWAFRGGAPVGVVTELTLGLVELGELAAGYLLWPAGDGAAVEALAGAWASALPGLTDTVTSTLALLALPPEGPFPEALLGSTVVHLSCASPAGVADLASPRDALRAVAEPAVDTIGPSDVARLATIHLDPPVPVPALGTGRWLTAGAAGAAAELLRSARIGEPGGLQMIELRHVATGAPSSAVDGAMTVPPGPFLVHAVGAAGDPAARDGVLDALAAVDGAAAAVDAGRAAPAFRDGRDGAGDAWPASELARLRAIIGALDPGGRLRFERGAREDR